MKFEELGLYAITGVCFMAAIVAEDWYILIYSFLFIVGLATLIKSTTHNIRNK